MARKRRKALLEKGAILLPAYEAEVGYGMNKGLRVSDRSLFHQVGPELTGEIELGIDLESLRNVDAAIAFLRGVIQLTERRMAGAGVIPCVRTFLRFSRENLMYFDPQARFKLF